MRSIEFFGDSLTDGAAWPDWVVATLRTHGHAALQMTNAGMGGNTVAQMKGRVVRDVLALMPEVVVLHAGTNDVLQGVEPMLYRRDLHAVVEAIRGAGIDVLLLTLPLVADASLNARLADLDEIIRDCAQQYGCRLVDMRVAFDTAVVAGREVICGDGVHHTIDGWRVMARTVLDALGCPAPVREEAILPPNAITDWRIGPAMTGEGVPVPPESDA